MRNGFFLLFALLCPAFSNGSLAAEAPLEGGVITERIEARVIPVRVQADAAELQRLAEQAFSAHGAFRVEQGAGASHTLRFAVAGANAVQVSVVSGGSTAFTQTASGSSLRNALLRAADAAVLHLTRRPGFFSGKLTFISESDGAGEVCISDFFFGEASQLTSDRSQSVTPRWAPDGRRIVYTGYYRNGYPDIYLIDTTARRRDVFVSLQGTNTGARFSPDGQRVAMILSGDGNPELYVTNAQGRGARRLTRTDRHIEATPSWSRGGDRIVYASDAMATGKPQLHVIAASGGQAQRLPTNISGYCAEPDWSHADPDLIAFTAASGSGYQIAVYSFSKRQATIVTNVRGDGIEPCWLNDGRHLIFTVRTAGSSRIYLLDTESRRATPLSPQQGRKVYQANFVYR